MPRVSDPDASLKAFLAANSGNNYKPGNELQISLLEAHNLAAAVRKSMFGNTLFENALFKHFTSYPLTKTTEPQMRNHNAEEMTTFKKTPMFTVINPVLDMADPNVKYETTYKDANTAQPVTLTKRDNKDALGTLLLHEMAHYQGFAQGLAAEGPAYGLEYYFVKRLGLPRIPDVMRGPADWNARSELQYLFCKWCLIMKWCHDNVDGKRTDITPAAARECIVDFMTQGEPFLFFGNDRSKAINWAAAEVTKMFGAWDGTQPLPGTKSPDGSTPYQTEAFLIIQPKLDAAIP